MDEEFYFPYITLHLSFVIGNDLLSQRKGTLNYFFPVTNDKCNCSASSCARSAIIHRFGQRKHKERRTALKISRFRPQRAQPASKDRAESRRHGDVLASLHRVSNRRSACARTGIE